jgi:hypothetical protein
MISSQIASVAALPPMIYPHKRSMRRDPCRPGECLEPVQKSLDTLAAQSNELLVLYSSDAAFAAQRIYVYI